MRVRMAFLEDDDGPTLISAYDEYTEDIWGGVPDFHRDVLDAQGLTATIRELDVFLPEGLIDGLFKTPQISIVREDEYAPVLPPAVEDALQRLDDVTEGFVAMLGREDDE